VPLGFLGRAGARYEIGTRSGGSSFGRQGHAYLPPEQLGAVMGRRIGWTVYAYLTSVQLAADSGISSSCGLAPHDQAALRKGRCWPARLGDEGFL
jgi:hypothetical protein